MRGSIHSNKKQRQWSFLLLSILLFSECNAFAWSFLSRRPLVRIFILAGDDNVEGYASIPHLHKLATNADTRKAYKHLIEKDGIKWKVRNDVFVTYDHKRDKKLSSGPLTVQGFGANPNTFGPEVGMGHVLGDMFTEPVILVKAGWSHRSLEKDFQAPSKDHPGGFQWFRLMTSLTETVENLETILGPEYKHARHQFSGLVWWHGYSDMEIAGATKTYPDHMTNWFHTIRSKIKLFLPIVVAELGGQGTESVSKEELAFREMQKSVVEGPAMRRNTVYVPTASYVKKTSEESPGSEEMDSYQHYYGRADTMIEIGNALGRALAKQTPGWTTNSRSSHAVSSAGLVLLVLIGMAFGGILLVVVFRRQLFSRSERKEIADFLLRLSPFRDTVPKYDLTMNGEIETPSYRD